jgi:hypothetical protein
VRAPSTVTLDSLPSARGYHRYLQFSEQEGLPHTFPFTATFTLAENGEPIASRIGVRSERKRGRSDKDDQVPPES